MKVPVYSLAGKELKKIDISRLFQLEPRDDVIRKAVRAELLSSRQPYGRDPLAGKRTSAHYHGRRHYRWTMMNREMARMKRIHHQGLLEWTARFVPQAVKGRLAHPPKAEKNLKKKVNKKEKLLAIFSALSASASPELVLKRGHKLGKLSPPFILENKLESLKKTKELEGVLKALGLEAELERVKQKKERAGKGKRRGRRVIKRKGPLIIVKEDKGIGKLDNLGVEIALAEKLKPNQLAPGGHPGRLCILSQAACEFLDKKAGELYG